jgi:hypothetical protein
MRRYHGRLKRNKAVRRYNRRLAKKDTSCIPEGIYCYTLLQDPQIKPGLIMPIKPCPYWSYNKKQHPQDCGYCKYLEAGDWFPRGSVPEATSLLWDMCKGCSVNWGPD